MDAARRWTGTGPDGPGGLAGGALPGSTSCIRAWRRCGSCSGGGRARASSAIPTIESANFGQEITFSHNGKPFLIYTSRTWLLAEDGTIGRPLAMEAGFWRPQADGMLEVVLAHPTGITEIYIGQSDGHQDRAGHRRGGADRTAKEVTAGTRLYGLIGADLGWAYDMAAVGQPLQSHVSAQLKRVG